MQGEVLETATNGHRQTISVRDLSVALYEQLAPLTPEQRGIVKYLLGREDMEVMLSAVAELRDIWKAATSRQRELTLKAVRNDLPMGRFGSSFGSSESRKR